MIFKPNALDFRLLGFILAWLPGFAGSLVSAPAAEEYLVAGREPVSVYYSPADEKVALAYLDWAEAWVPRPEWMRGRPFSRLEIWVAPSLGEFHRLTGGLLPEWGVACALPEDAEVIVRSPRIVELWREEPREVLSHEIAHVFLYQFLGGAEVPRWFHEGFALYCSRMWDLDDFLDFSVALLLGRTFTLDQLKDGMPADEDAARRAYLQSYTVVEYMFNYWDPLQQELLFRSWRAEGDLDRALRNSLGLTLAQFEERWAGWAGVRYGWLKLVTSVTLLWIVAAVLFLAVYVIKRRKFRRKLGEMRLREEEAWRRTLPGVFTPPLPDADSQQADWKPDNGPVNGEERETR